MIDKHEESDLDMDDVITEAPTSPQSPPQQLHADEEMVVPNRSTHEMAKDKEQIQSLKIKRTSDSSSYRIVANDKEKHGTQTEPKTPMNIKKDRPATPYERSSARSSAKRPHSRELNALSNDDHSKQAARITKRRSTMAIHCLGLDASNARAGRKRRLSSPEKNADATENAGTTHRTRNSSGSGDKDTATSKRMRLEQNAAKPDGAADAAKTLSTTPKRSDTTTKSTQDNSNSLSSNIVAASAVDTTVTAMVTLSTPRTNKSTNRREKSKATTATPRITQYFAQQKTSTPVPAPSTVATPASAAAAPVAAQAPASLLCEKCSIILSSINELNFHKKSHELNCCVKCKKSIDDAENPISAHVVSCFLLDNSISNDLLKRFLKVKVDLDRLTPIKIKQIQKDLQSPDSQNENNGVTAKASTENTKNRHHESNATKEPPDSVNRRQSKENPRRESSPSAVENAQNSINDGRNDSGMSICPTVAFLFPHPFFTLNSRLIFIFFN